MELLSFTKYRDKIVVKLDPGVYVFNSFSGTGKTVLASLLDKYRGYGERVASYTYRDYVKGLPISSILDPDKYDLIVLDRYDLYYGAGEELLKVCARDKRCIVIIDCTCDFAICACGLVEILLSKSEIEVF